MNFVSKMKNHVIAKFIFHNHPQQLSNRLQMCVKNEKRISMKKIKDLVHFIFYTHPQIGAASIFGAHQEFGGRCLKFCFRTNVVYAGFSLDKNHTGPRSCGHTKAVSLHCKD